jgi:oligo-1,6-glucosidase
VDGSEWWRSAVVYQVYPRSFADSNGDGIGDLRGVIEHLDHIAGLGIDVIWLSPVYRSPQDDNGYDISDYEDIDPTFGTLADLDDLIAAVHERGMKLVMDLVVNHTSDEHPWFLDSASSPTAEHADWYIWRDPTPGFEPGTPGAEPNNWGSFFSGSAWNYVPARGQYYLHLFSPKQPDLDWDNFEVRAAIYGMMNRWLDRGVDGFRMDVINFISKDPALPDGAIGSTGYGDGTPHFAYGPHIHDYLAEMQREVFASRSDAYLTVGEMPATTPERALRFTDAETGQLAMVFQFEHMDLDGGPDGKWSRARATVPQVRASLSRWQDAMGSRGWNSLYWNNHDQPRVVSRFGDDRDHWFASATALATVLHLQRGTPYVYQGEELGMTNAPFDSIDDYRDIETVNYYADAVDRLGRDADEVLAAIRSKSRDNARTPVQWSAEPHAGFSTVQPWIGANPNYLTINAAAQTNDPNSIYAFYKRLIALRHDESIVVHGDFGLVLGDHPTVFAYTRSLGPDALLVLVNLSSGDASFDRTALPDGEWTLVLANIPGLQEDLPTTLGAWEGRVYRRSSSAP